MRGNDKRREEVGSEITAKERSNSMMGRQARRGWEVEPKERVNKNKD